jgi:hypothetical protein|nr:MAG TPA: hypothetical protein [Caudoviricetes sp.]
MNENLDFLDAITLVSFILQVQNNDEFHKQASNDEVIENLHNDIMSLMIENRQLSKKIIEQNEEIIKLLKEGKL